MTNLYAQWLQAKEAENAAKENRREIEEKLLKSYGVKGNENGTKTFKDQGYKVKLTFRIDQKVDPVSLKEIAIENGLENQLDALFRWKPEVNRKAWNATAAEITKPLLGAITNTPGKPSFVIEKVEPETVPEETPIGIF